MYLELFQAFLIGLGASFFSGFVSGGLGILAFAGLFTLGLPAYTVLGTFKVGALGNVVGSFYTYFSAKKIVWRLVLPMTVFGLVGSMLGARLILAIDEAWIEKIIGFGLLAFIPLSLCKPDLGVVHRQVSNVRRKIGHIMYFFISMWGGSVTIGTGVMMLFSQAYFYGLTILEIKGTNKIPGFIKIVGAVAVFAYYEAINWPIAGGLAVGMAIGGYISAHYAIKMGDSWLRIILLVGIVLFAMKYIFGL